MDSLLSIIHKTRTRVNMRVQDGYVRHASHALSAYRLLDSNISSAISAAIIFISSVENLKAMTTLSQQLIVKNIKLNIFASFV